MQSLSILRKMLGIELPVDEAAFLSLIHICTGIIPILLEARSKGASFTGLEIQPESADMASRSVQLNDLQERVHIVNGDIKEAVQIFGAASCHVVTSNPPYMTAQHGLQNPDQPKAIARHEVLCTLEDVISQAAGLLMPGGRFYICLLYTSSRLL